MQSFKRCRKFAYKTLRSGYQRIKTYSKKLLNRKADLRAEKSLSYINKDNILWKKKQQKKIN